ncbi:hypothetical protein BDZ89DRAFT_1155378 [Hymenopellis radicata]|nr:hypothetical protein BDZ89DRAFT_1155378 [Hymenopellis radicata]
MSGLPPKPPLTTIHPSKSRRGGIKRSKRQDSDAKPPLAPAPSSKRPRLESDFDLVLSDDDDISGGNIDSPRTSMFDVEELCTQFQGVLADDAVVRDLADIFGDDAYEEEYTIDDSKRMPKQRAYSEKDLKTSFERDIACMVKEANENKGVSQGFKFGLAIKPKGVHLATRRAPPEVTIWDDDTARCLFSEDGIPLVYHLPRFLRETSNTILTSHLVQYGKRAPLAVGTGADKDGRNSASAYVFRDGEVSGCSVLARLWHGVGRTDIEPTISTTFLHTGTQFNNATALVHHLYYLSIRVNKLLECIDSKQFAALQELVKRAEAAHPHTKALGTIDPLLMEGRAIQFNRTTPNHADTFDPPKGWAVIVVLGRVRSGTLFFPRLNLRVRYCSGVGVALRGRLLKHEVEVWEGEQRISIAHFTHAGLWNFYKVECP